MRTIFAVMSASICMIADDSDLAALVLSSRRELNMDEEDDSWDFRDDISAVRALFLELKSLTIGASFWVNKSFSWSCTEGVSAWLIWEDEVDDVTVISWLVREDALDTIVTVEG